MQVPEDPHSISDEEHVLSPGKNLQSKTTATVAATRTVPRARAIHSDLVFEFEVHGVPEDLRRVWTTGVETCVVTLGAYWGTGDG